MAITVEYRDGTYQYHLSEKTMINIDIVSQWFLKYCDLYSLMNINFLKQEHSGKQTNKQCSQKSFWRRKRPINSVQANESIFRLTYEILHSRGTNWKEARSGKTLGILKTSCRKQESISLIIKWHVVPSIWLGKHHFSKMMEAIFGNIHARYLVSQKRLLC